MLSSSCPSCGSPLTFRSGAALTAICANCGSCVVREGDLLKDYGKIARFQRDLSPIQLDARGNLDGKSFRVAGVLRKARARVRWNEWYVQFDDGTDGWIGEGNGQWFAYGSSVDVPSPPRGGAGAKVEIGGIAFQVMEDSEAAIVAAEGTLPMAVHPNVPMRYMDLRERGGARVGTLDFDGGPTLWIGRDVTLVQLQMEGLRAFAGWSDPALVHFAGPEITDVRALKCPGCGASLPLRAPGATVRLVCEYCGSVASVEADGDLATAALIERAEKAAFKTAIPLGARGKLRGTDWVVIGAMVRSVYADHQEWSWTEYLLHNPYRGFAWLVDDTQRHWSFVEPLRGEVPATDHAHAVWKERGFARFQSGEAQVKRVLGEFTWEVAIGDRAFTMDYIDPPTMLSAEHSGDELVWTVGTWTPAAEVAGAFGVELPKPRGIAPHQPNPQKAPARVGSVTMRGLALFALACVLLVLAILLPASETVIDHEYLVVSGDNAWVTDSLVLAEDEIVDVHVDAALPSAPDVIVSFISDSGQVWDWTTFGASDATVALEAGTWSGRVALATTPTDADAGRLVKLRVVRDPGSATVAIMLFFYALFAPIAYFLDLRTAEQTRWSNAGDT